MDLQRLLCQVNQLIASSNQLRSSLTDLTQDFRQLEAQVDVFGTLLRTCICYPRRLHLSKELRRMEEEKEEILLIHSLVSCHQQFEM